MTDKILSQADIRCAARTQSKSLLTLMVFLSVLLLLPLFQAAHACVIPFRNWR